MSAPRAICSGRRWRSILSSPFPTRPPRSWSFRPCSRCCSLDAALMASTPADDHTEEFEQLAGLSAADALQGAELARLVQHAAHCERSRLTARPTREPLAWPARRVD